jgi:excisionase family DNA binding protein
MILLQITTDELDARLRAAVKAEISQFQAPQKDKLLTRFEAAEMLNVTLPTLNAWEKSGQIKAIRIGNRVYFKESSLLQRA